MITIVDYNAGNIKSIVNMLRSLSQRTRLAETPEDVLSADKLILPGVGHFDFGVEELEKRGLREALDRRVVKEGVPLLGICLGAQLLTHGSDEGERPGLGWIDGRTVSFDRARMGTDLKVPHMGWSDTTALRDNPLTAGLPDDMRFYYVHSYHIECRDPAQAILSAWHGYGFPAGVQRGNILGVQFHPEKSHRFGMALLRNFIAWRPETGTLPATRAVA